MNDKTTVRRDWAGVALATLLLPPVTWLLFVLYHLGAWWGYLLIVPFGLLFAVLAYGLGESLARVPRNDIGVRR